MYHPFCVNTVRDKKTALPYTTLYYNNPQSYIFRLHETNIIRIHASVFTVVCIARAAGFFWYIFLKREADYGCLVQPKHVALWITITKRRVCTLCVTVTELIFSACRSCPFTRYQNHQRNTLDTKEREAFFLSSCDRAS